MSKRKGSLKKDTAIHIVSTNKFKLLMWEAAAAKNQTLSDYVMGCVRADMTKNGIKFDIY